MHDMYIERAATARLHALLASFPAVVVTGARQVGKSTLLAHAMGGTADFVVFDPVVDVENARREPELFLDNHRTPLVLDDSGRLYWEGRLTEIMQQPEIDLTVALNGPGAAAIVYFSDLTHDYVTLNAEYST